MASSVFELTACFNMVFFEILLSAQNAGFPRSSQLCYVYYKIYVSSTDYISGISVVLPERNIGDPQVVICSITSATVLDANSVTTSWTGPNGVIDICAFYTSI